MDIIHQSNKRDFAGLEVRRMKAAVLFRNGKTRAAVARELDVSRQTTSRWHKTWKTKSKKGLKAAGRAGRMPKLNYQKRKKIGNVLLKGPRHYGYATQLWTLNRIAEVIHKIYQVEYHPGHVWRILRELGWSCQRPETRARERNEKAIQNWVKYKWPGIKKKPGN